MVTLEHPNGCVHSVREDLVSKFIASGWVIKAAQTVPPISHAEQTEPKKRKPRKKKQ